MAAWRSIPVASFGAGSSPASVWLNPVELRWLVPIVRLDAAIPLAALG